MLPRDERLNTAEFAAAFAGGQTLRHPLLQVRVFRCARQELARREEQEKKDRIQRLRAAVQEPAAVQESAVVQAQVRAAFVVPKKLGKATVRNRVRRRLRERYRSHPLRGELNGKLSGCDLIFMAAPPVLTANTAQIDEALTQLLRRAARSVASERVLNERVSND